MTTVSRIKKRADFLTVGQKGGKYKTPSFCFSYLFTEKKECRVGFTASKKVGNAVIRNKCKRRLRSLVQMYLKNPLNEKSIDIVLIAYKGLHDRSFETVKLEFETAINHLKRKIKNSEQNTDFSSKVL